MHDHALHPVTNLETCMTCPYRRKPVNGKSLCSRDASGRSIVELAKSAACPLGLHVVAEGKAPSTRPVLPPKTSGPGDLIEWAAKHTGAHYLAVLYTHVTGRRCGCAERKEKLNKWWSSIVNSASRR